MSSHALGYPSSSVTSPIGQRKVAIPRLQRADLGQNFAKERRRVPRACTACRSHKIKCTGERPFCKHCATTSRECVYIMPRKDRLKVVMDQCGQMADLLRRLRSCARAEDKDKIAHILGAVDEELSEYGHTMASSNTDPESYDSHESVDMSGANRHEELNTDFLDPLVEDLHKDDRARATGFVGKNSEIHWLREVTLPQPGRGDEDMSGRIPQQGGLYVPGSEQVSFFSYWADGEDVDVDFFVDSYELPPPDTAERLLQCYMLKVHSSFPILPRKVFEDQFRKYFTALRNGNAPRLSPSWQAILNMVFAIGAKFSHLIQANWQDDERDHLIYQTRARAFGLNQTTITTHSDLPQIQSLGLLAFYWLSVGQVSRAWTVIGIALRFAYSLGLHVRNEDPSATAGKRETLVRTWWSLYSLERTLSVITGRPSIIVDAYCSVPLPIPLPEEEISENVEATYRARRGSTTTLLESSPIHASSSNVATELLLAPTNSGTADANSGSYFKAVVQLSIITQSILPLLYSAGTVIRPPSKVQQDMTQLNMRLDQWIISLPVQLSFKFTNNEPSDVFNHERLLLEFQFCSAKILLTRPCLSAWKQPWHEPNEASFPRQMANSCIEAAKVIVSLLQDGPHTNSIYSQGPWWCIIHHAMQAISVLLLGLSYPSSTSYNSTMLVHDLKKAIRWLQRTQDPVAESAYKVALSAFESVARRCSVDVSDLRTVGTEATVAARGQILPHAVSDAGMVSYLPAHFVTMAMPPVAHPALATHPTYDTMMGGGPFPSQNEAPILNESYYMAR
ncbi:C6 transcription factor-like protein [Cucurbitaria berberidis CBS 394.84]|uniref:C6 transcription factor-like protein n=1 Tax=Cucurbitaria berberidis CBS 394.84 TaxID=1168544 RepID=A0A9P4LF48_9PLEO|nr:C6 transcription factor-like protein [Cucurbitaria berberidis CBS 394.84]KAF1852037.1 C6 transcription factor-like protein [Cucurbitaria berberidis CBS 394.84]